MERCLETKRFPKQTGIQTNKEDSKWNFVLADNKGHEIDVHAVVLDEKGHVIDGIMYPSGVFTGNGKINGQAVKCISPEFMVEALAKWVHKWPEKYITAIEMLCEKFGIELPKEYNIYVKNSKEVL